MHEHDGVEPHGRAVPPHRLRPFRIEHDRLVEQQVGELGGRFPGACPGAPAAAAVRERVGGLTLGADDYLVKPFAFVELSARVHALLRRSQPATPTVLSRAGIDLDPVRRIVDRDGAPVELTRK